MGFLRGELSVFMYLAYSHTAAGQADGVAVGTSAAETGTLRVLPRGGAVARVRHVRAVHRRLAVSVLTTRWE